MGKVMSQLLASIDFSKTCDTFAWYTVVTRFNYEAKFVSELLDKVSQNEYLLEYFDDIFIPEKKCTVEYINIKGKIAKRIITDKTMSLYVFVKAKMNEQIYWLIRNTIGCATILAVGDALVVISDEEANKHRQDADITEDKMKNMVIVSKVNPFFNPFLELKGIESNQEKIINIKKQKQEESNIADNVSLSKDNTRSTSKSFNRDIYAKRTKVESLPSVDDIDPQVLLKKLRRKSLTNEFFQLANKDVSFLSEEDLKKLQMLVKRSQDIPKPQNCKKKFNKRANNKFPVKSNNSQKPKYKSITGKSQNNELTTSAQVSSTQKSSKQVLSKRHRQVKKHRQLRLPYRIIKRHHQQHHHQQHQQFYLNRVHTIHHQNFPD